MSNTSVNVSIILPATPRAIYEAWLDSALHTEMTGAEAVCSGEVGGVFTAWDGYISGKNLDLTPGVRIQQAWRTSDFGEEDPDSHLEITLAEDPEGCLMTLNHTEIPDGQPDYEQGWNEFYFDPMVAYFSEKNAAENPEEEA